MFKASCGSYVHKFDKKLSEVYVQSASVCSHLHKFDFHFTNNFQVISYIFKTEKKAPILILPETFTSKYLSTLQLNAQLLLCGISLPK